MIITNGIFIDVKMQDNKQLMNFIKCTLNIVFFLFLFFLFFFVVFFYTGNHESVYMNQMYGFEGEVKAKYPFVQISFLP